MTKTPNIPVAKQGLDSLPRYVAGGHTIAGFAEPIVLSANENPRGPSGKAIAAMVQAAQDMHRYPNGNPADLKQAIAEHYAISPDMGEIILGAGSDEIISLLANGFAQAGAKVLISQYGFLMYAIAVKAAGAMPKFVPEQDYRTDIDAILQAADDQTSMVFLANPNNPTGSYLRRAEIERLVAELPPHVLLVLDCAYSEYVTEDDYSDHHDLVATGRMVVLHTFSKVHGLAGARLGWGLAAAKIADIYERLRSPFNVSATAIAGGLAAVQDQEYLRETLAMNRHEREKLVQGLAECGICVLPSVTNFLLLDLGSEDAALAAEQTLLAHGILARNMAGYNLHHCIRLSIGLAEENAAVLNALRTHATH